jgi:hypothetical protein
MVDLITQYLWGGHMSGGANDQIYMSWPLKWGLLIRYLWVGHMSAGHWSDVYEFAIWVGLLIKYILIRLRAMVWKVFMLAARTESSVKIKCGVNIAIEKENKW